MLHRAGVVLAADHPLRIMSHPLDSIFCPRSVAVIGASNAPEKYGYIILKNILDAGFAGAVYPVNPKADVVGSIRAYPSIGEVPDDVELAVIVVPDSAASFLSRERRSSGRLMVVRMHQSA